MEQIIQQISQKSSPPIGTKIVAYVLIICGIFYLLNGIKNPDFHRTFLAFLFLYSGLFGIFSFLLLKRKWAWEQTNLPTKTKIVAWLIRIIGIIGIILSIVLSCVTIISQAFMAPFALLYSIIISIYSLLFLFCSFLISSKKKWARWLALIILSIILSTGLAGYLYLVSLSLGKKADIQKEKEIIEEAKEIVRRTGNVDEAASKCKEISVEKSEKGYVYCITEVAIGGKDASVCEKYVKHPEKTTGYWRHTCYEKVAIAINDFSVCHLIEGRSADSCYVQLAFKNSDTSICDFISTDMSIPHHYDREDCYDFIEAGEIKF